MSSTAAVVRVSWGPFTDFTRRGFDATDVEQGSLDHVEDVRRRMRAGEDIPPLFRWRGSRGADPLEPLDGRHRAHAARGLRLRRAPIAEITYPSGGG